MFQGPYQVPRNWVTLKKHIYSFYSVRSQSRFVLLTPPHPLPLNTNTFTFLANPRDERRRRQRRGGGGSGDSENRSESQMMSSWCGEEMRDLARGRKSSFPWVFVLVCAGLGRRKLRARVCASCLVLVRHIFPNQSSLHPISFDYMLSRSSEFFVDLERLDFLLFYFIEKGWQNIKRMIFSS